MNSNLNRRDFLKAAKNDKYEYVRRVANRLVSVLQEADHKGL
jgi:hypothetical protein